MAAGSNGKTKLKKISAIIIYCNRQNNPPYIISYCLAFTTHSLLSLLLPANSSYLHSVLICRAISRTKLRLSLLFDGNICTHILTTNDSTNLDHFTSYYLICDDNQVL